MKTYADFLRSKRENVAAVGFKVDDTILSPFMGIGSEGYVSVRHNRRFVGCELKPSYFRVACENLRDAERSRINVSDLFSFAENNSADGLEDCGMEA